MDNYFDIAHYTGHKSFDELFNCFSLYTSSIKDTLAVNNIQVQSLDFKSNSSLESLKDSLSIYSLELNQLDHIDSFHFGSFLSSIRKKEIEFCINSAIFFQVMMEASINDILGKNNNSFNKKWRNFLTDNEANSMIIECFESYTENIYKTIRNKTVHPEGRTGIVNIENFRFPFLHKYIKDGWSVFVFSLSVIHKTQIDYEQSWNEMCNIFHKIPSVIVETEFPDISSLSNSLYKKHLDGINN